MKSCILQKVKTIIVSPPFGTLVRHKKCTSVLGTYTLERRGSWATKIWRVILTVRPTKGGWVNKIGLQNPGIKSVKHFQSDKIYSIAAISPEDWNEIINYIPEYAIVEMNLSCPNVGHSTDINDTQIEIYLKKFQTVIFKLSPTNEMYNQVDRLVKLGAKYIHIANTIPVPEGGESGERLKTFSLKAIRELKPKYPSINFIGGGGIYSIKDLQEYKESGAEYFSLASIWFNPLKALRLLRKI